MKQPVAGLKPQTGRTRGAGNDFGKERVSLKFKQVLRKVTDKEKVWDPWFCRILEQRYLAY
jgi:hypothetical protein